MKIAIGLVGQVFETEFQAYAKLDEYNQLSRSSEGDPDMQLTEIKKHTSQDIWWFNFTDCVENGGVNKQVIADDVVNLDTFDVDTLQELVDMGYLPAPEQPTE